MDCRQVRAGASVFLPVSVEGALLALGDVHALMGDGEVGGCGAEVRAKVTLRTAVVSDKVPTPCVVTPEAVSFVASAQTLDECERMVLAKAHRFLAEQMGLDPDEALRIMSLVGDLGVCQVVDPLKTMRFALPVAVLERLGTSVVLPGPGAPRRP
jgi:amidase